MTFELRINGEKAWETERQVLQVSLMSGRGEAGRIGISTEGVVDIIVTEVSPAGPMRLDHIEAIERQQNAERMNSGSQGFLSPENYQPAADANKAVQGDSTYLANPNDNPAEGSLTSGSTDGGIDLDFNSSDNIILPSESTSATSEASTDEVETAKDENSSSSWGN